jgi:hypothetical protein
MSITIQLNPQPIQMINDCQIRSCLAIFSENGTATEKRMWFSYPLDVPMPEDSNCESYLLASLLPAMQLNADISVKGKVSKQLLANLTELQYIWNKWSPNDFHLIHITADEVTNIDVSQNDDAVVAFSGGVDAQFSTYRHATKQAGYATKNLKAGVLIHGFDIALDDDKSFAVAKHKAKLALDNLQVKLFTVSTNIRELWNLNWEMYCGTAIASVLNNFQQYAQFGLIGSGEAYDALVSPWGSHPLTDPLASSKTFQIIHDGAGFNRTEKIQLLSTWQTGIKNLRVCWAGDDLSKNCGKCEKCVRTRLNFVASGLPNPECFDTPLTKSLLKPILLRSDASKAEWHSIYQDIVKSNNAKEWLPDIQAVINRKPRPSLYFLFPPNSKRREWVKNTINKLKKQ